ncbi:MAG: hypothetical protein U5J96_00200 [Ignavibacteriaceae bacterium]|nr:hypothetical protein [Ignavibacteriaceae bacterium]
MSGTLTPTIGASFTNNTGSLITQIPITYTGEQWRAGVTNRGAADRLDFQFSTDATSLSTGTWTNYDALDFNVLIFLHQLGHQMEMLLEIELLFHLPLQGLAFWMVRPFG